MRKTQYYDTALKAAKAVPVITKSVRESRAWNTTSRDTQRRMRMMIRFHRPRHGGQHGLPMARAGRPLRARNAFLALQLQCHGKGLMDYARQFRIVAYKSEA